MIDLKLIAAFTLMSALVVGCASAAESPAPPGKDLTVYHLGNSLTRCIPLERLAELFKSVDGRYDYGMQLGGGHRLEQHLSMRNHGNAPGEGSYNIKAPYGKWDHAFRNRKFDAVIMQTYKSELDEPEKVRPRWPYYTAGSLQAAGKFIDYARGDVEPGDSPWYRAHPNTENVATDRFYIYAIWPTVGDILEQEGEKTYAGYWRAEYRGEVQACADFFDKLVTRLNERHPDLPVPVRMIPSGHVLAALDVKIREDRLPGIEAFYARNQAYFMKSRRNNKKVSAFNPDEFVRSAGVLNFYADGVHMNDQPHNGRDSGTIGSYATAATHYATLTGESPVGLTVEPYEQFNPEADAELIEAIQETVWDVVNDNPHTGVSPEELSE